MAKQPKEKPELTVQQLAAMGGAARARKLNKARRKEIASAAAKARWGAKKDEVAQ
jgi:hypothetical protein